MDDVTRKIGMLIAAFDEEHIRLQAAVQALHRSGAQLQYDMRGAAREAVEAALEELHPHLDKAGQTLVDLQRLSLWRAAWQYAVVAAVAITMALLAVKWYVPPLSEIIALRSEREQLQAAIENLNQRGARISLRECGSQKRLCVQVDKNAGIFGIGGNKEEPYMVVKGY